MPCLIAIATYNERENLPLLVESIFAHVPDCHLLVVDDNSPDGTGRWAEERSRSEPRLRCLHRAGKLGLGTATVAGLRYGLEHHYDPIVTMDADFSHHPRYLPAMLQRLDDPVAGPVDVVVGSRYITGGGVEGWPWQRRWMSRGINWFSRIWLNLPVRDTSGSYRVYRAAALRRLDLDSIRSQGYSVFEELLWRLARRQVPMAEQPIVFVDRDLGHSKITAAEALRSILQLLRLRGQA